MRLENKQIMPSARKADLVVKELPDELLVYDLKRDRAHSLNQSAAFIWKKCNGRRTVSEVAQALGEEFKIPADEQTIWLALEQLSKLYLLEERIARPTGMPRISRRDMMRLGAAAAFALPIIVSIVAPTAANAQSSISTAVCNARVQPNCLGTPCTGGGPNCLPFGAVTPGGACKCQ